MTKIENIGLGRRVYDTHAHQSRTRRAVDSAELLARSAKWRARAAAFALGFVCTILMLWISGGVR